MQKTRPDQAPPTLELRDTVARRFPLVPRARPACPALDIRVAQVRDLARAAAQHTSESLARAAEAHNLTALIMSDCGLPALARTLCWQQFDVLRTARPATAATAKLALQPIINLSRLRTRDGDGAGADHLLDALFEAIRSRTDTVIDGRTIRSADIISHDDDHRQVIQWLWPVLLADGTRALAQAGRWAEALQHARQHNGIGARLLDGRQIAILAHCAARDYDTASSVLAGTSTPTPWEEAVAACLRVLCLTLADRPADSAITTMTDTYIALEPAREHAVFRVRLGLCAIDLADGGRRVPQIADVVMRDALQTADAYAAHEALSHQACLSHTAPGDSRTLAEIVQAAGLGRGTMPSETLDDLMESVRVSEASMAGTLAAQAREHGTGPPSSSGRPNQGSDSQA
jgi:hypothetical protein